MTGDQQGMRRVWPRLWKVLSWQPVTWRQAVVQALVIGVVFLVAMQIFGVVSLRDDPWFAALWVPLWLASSMIGYRLRSRGRQRDAAYREPYPPR